MRLEKTNRNPRPLPSIAFPFGQRPLVPLGEEKTHLHLLPKGGGFDYLKDYGFVSCKLLTLNSSLFNVPTPSPSRRDGGLIT